MLTPLAPGSAAPETDALSQILRSLRLESGLISRGHFTAPWGVHAGASQSAIFHAVVEGRCEVKRDSDTRAVTLEPGELVVITGGDAHVVRDCATSRPRPLRSLPTRRVQGLTLVEHGGGGAPTRVLCGRFTLNHSAASLTELLPPLVVMKRRQSRVVEWLNTTLDLIDLELDNRRSGSDEILARLTDILFVQILRTYAMDLGPGEGGWLGAAQDSRVAAALVCMHDAPAQPWTPELLARRVGMSRSAFYTRFTEVVGESPSRYLVRWRMAVAADLMRQHDVSVAELAERVGYSSEDAFSRAFRRTMGKSPSVWRRALSADR